MSSSVLVATHVLCDHAPAIMSFAERRLDLPDRNLSLALLDWGGPTGAPLIVLVHANGACAAPWDPIARVLSDRYRVVGYDLRGHGASDKPEPTPENYSWDTYGDDLVAVCRALGPVHMVVGHSFSGSCAALGAQRAPDAFGRLVMVDPVLLPHDPTAAERVAELTMKKRPLPSRAEAMAVLRKSALYRRFERESLELFVEYGHAPDAQGVWHPKCPLANEAAGYRNRVGGDRIVAAAAGLAMPILVLWSAVRRGADEPIEARHNADALASGPRRLLVELPESGHFAPMEIAPGRTSTLAAIEFFAGARFPA